MSLTIAENGSANLGKDRHLVCLEAAWEIEALAYALPHTTDSDYLARSIGGRLLTLAQALMGALGDEMETTANLQKVVMVSRVDRASPMDTDADVQAVDDLVGALK